MINTDSAPKFTCLKVSRILSGTPPNDFFKSIMRITPAEMLETLNQFISGERAIRARYGNDVALEKIIVRLTSGDTLSDSEKREIKNAAIACEEKQRKEMRPVLVRTIRALRENGTLGEILGDQLPFRAIERLVS